MRFKKIIFRATRGKALTYLADLEASDYSDYPGKGGERRLRTVYVIIFSDGPHIRDRLQKICDSFMGNSFEIP